MVYYICSNRRISNWLEYRVETNKQQKNTRNFLHTHKTHLSTLIVEVLKLCVLDEQWVAVFQLKRALSEALFSAIRVANKNTDVDLSWEKKKTTPREGETEGIQKSVRKRESRSYRQFNNLFPLFAAKLLLKASSVQTMRIDHWTQMN